jgi:hypothetical protein
MVMVQPRTLKLAKKGSAKVPSHHLELGVVSFENLSG